MFPSRDTIFNAFVHHPINLNNLKEHRNAPALEQPDVSASTNRQLFPAWSAIDDPKKKANDLATEATREFNAASQMAQAKAGKIEMGTPKYYAACTFGGLLACVSSIH